VTQHADQLREAFESHENNTPDPGAVYARVQELARKHKRRRRGSQVAGGAVLGAGLIAAGINLPAFLPGNAHSNTGPTGINAAGLPNDVPSVAASYSDADQQKDWDAYFNAGYGNRVIISHGWLRGASMATSYNHLTRWVVHPGQHVTADAGIKYLSKKQTSKKLKKI